MGSSEGALLVSVMFAREIRCSNAIRGIAPGDKKSDENVAVAIVGPMTPDEQVRVNVCASNYMEKARDMVKQSDTLAKK
jgi:hypothetical protein